MSSERIEVTRSPIKTALPRRKKSDDREIVLLCNPQAGGRWKELADILDSSEAKNVRRIVTDSIADIGPALSELSRSTQLVCIYGGDGTIQKLLDKLYQETVSEDLRLAFIGGGTMNVTAGWCGLSRSPGKNFRHIIQAHESDQLLFREVPLLEIQQGDQVHVGFTFGMGPLIRVLNEFENGHKSKMAAVGIVAKSVASIFSKYPASYQPVLKEMTGEILIDGELVPHDVFTAVFCNITGKLNIGVEPFPNVRTRDTFHCAAYAVNRREFAAFLPFLARGWVPIDPKSLIKDVSTWKQLALAYLGKDSFPTDPRYINKAARHYEIRTDEEIYTVDGEIFRSNGEPFSIKLGPTLKLAVGPTVGLGTTMRLAADVQEQLHIK